MKMFAHQLLKAAKILGFCLIFFGILYPAAVWGCSNLFFSKQAGGSFENTAEGRMSLLAGQNIEKDENLWGRRQNGQIIQNTDGTYSLMAIPADHNTGSEEYIQETERYKLKIERRNPEAKGKVPEELYTWSASGMDPDISLDAALYQIPRIARARNVSEETIEQLIESAAENPLPGSDSGKRVNIVKVNLALNDLGR